MPTEISKCLFDAALNSQIKFATFLLTRFNTHGN